LEEIFLKILDEISVMKCWPPSAEAVKLAGKLNLTYYDAAYLNQAKKLGLTLITEDNELKEKAEKVIEVMKTDNII